MRAKRAGDGVSQISSERSERVRAERAGDGVSEANGTTECSEGPSELKLTSAFFGRRIVLYYSVFSSER